MKRSWYFLFAILLLAGALLSACNLPGSKSVLTAQAVTQSARETNVLFNTMVAALSQTPLPYQSPTATLPGTPPPGYTAPPPPPTSTPGYVAPCDQGEFVQDVTVPDGTLVAAGATFAKTWRIRNIGTCTWTTGYSLVFSSGTSMGAPASVALPATVAPGGTVDVTVNLTAPAVAGSYTANFLLRNPGGSNFGFGGVNAPIWAVVTVTAFSSDPVPASIYPYDFSAQICAATWQAATGGVQLPCPASTAQNAWAAILMNPRLEDGRTEDERTIWMHPYGGWIQATYPSYLVQAGDRFRTWVGCLHGATGCNVTFKVDYKTTDGVVHPLSSWDETYDSTIHSYDMDLTALVGYPVQFILTVRDNGNPSAAQAFWLVPSIQRYYTPTPTVTSTVTLTPTPP